MHSQLTGYLKASRELKPAIDKTDKVLSVIAGVLLIGLFLFNTILLVLNFETTTEWVVARYVIMIIPMIGLILAFFKGVSVKWMFTTSLKYWIPTILLLIVYYVVFTMAIDIFYGWAGDFELGVKGGVMLCSLGFCGALAYLYEGKKNRQLTQTDMENKKTHQAVATGSYVMAFVWTAFFVGGVIMLLWGTGAGDALFNQFFNS